MLTVYCKAHSVNHQVVGRVKMGTMIIQLDTEQAMRAYGEQLGRVLRGGEVLELIGDVGAGKTTLTKGIAQGLGVEDNVQSPSFTISAVYPGRDGLHLAHYDFYRLNDPGIMADELSETVSSSDTVTVIEWANTVANVLPLGHFRLLITAPSDSQRILELPDELAGRIKAGHGV